MVFGKHDIIIKSSEMQKKLEMGAGQFDPVSFKVSIMFKFKLKVRNSQLLNQKGLGNNFKHYEHGSLN